MQRFSSLVLLLGSYLFMPVVFSYASPNCKNTPNSGWPSPRQWDDLNAQVGGNLIRSNPPGAVCHSDQPSYNKNTCTIVQSQWTNSSFHSGNPVSVDYNDDACPPLSQSHCSKVGYPIYVINASTAAHIQAGVNFARENNIRLIVKGTGHDYNGRFLALPSDLQSHRHY